MKKIVDFMDKNSKYVIGIFLLNLFLDILVVPTTLLMGSSFHLGLVIKPLIMLLYFIYIFTKGNRKKKMVASLVILSGVLTFLTIIISQGTSGILFGLQTAFKFVNLIFCILFFDIYIKKQNLKELEGYFFNYIFIGVIIVGIVFLISNITGTAILSYSSEKIGNQGWFYAANDIGHLLSILFPLVLFGIFYNGKFSKALKLIGLFVVIICVLAIGTKVPWITLYITFLGFIIFFIGSLFFKTKNHKKELFFVSSLLILLIVFSPIIPAYRNISIQDEWGGDTSDLILSGRDDKLDDFIGNSNSSALNFLFGYGRVDSFVGSSSDDFIEMDFYDLYFTFGFFGVFIFVLVILNYLIKILIQVIKNFKDVVHFKSFSMAVSVGLALGIAYIAGHTFLSFSVATLFGMCLIFLYKNIVPEKKKRVMFVASVGGHLTQLLQLESIFKDYEYVLITEKTDVTINFRKKYNTEYMIYGNRKDGLKYAYLIFWQSCQALYYILKYNPDTIVTTGTQIATLVCYIGKVFGSRIIFIESYAKQSGRNLSGILMYPITDVFIVQWKSMLKYYKKAKYIGGIY